ncbi:hypothetical protein BO99DRAFT_110724 [Aspergillus violaceofuscus CBS 115571]|uniref:Uncharacterized protein n=1 Tax=Aspergillus violaceofuscus (strain CBS 115571) TaxID=1450538 RepID=A0A2V5IKS3_ASPV1|nr:hypothetical protein BO99DRAFT_110724 [Aspergillus violaceofuscus CBS 115571]
MNDHPNQEFATGSMMTEIGLAQQRLFDDDEVQMVDLSRQHPREHAHLESTHAVTMLPRQSEEQVSVDPTGYPYTSDPSSYSAIDSNISPAQAGLSLSSNTHPNTSSLNATPPPQQYEAPLSDLQNEHPMHTHVEVPIRPHHHDFSSIPSFDPSSAAAQTSSSSFNVFEALLPPLQNVYPEDTDHHQHNNFSYSAATVPTEVAPTSSPRRVASLRATPFSPHDTQPLSPVPSAAKASRSKTENQLRSTPTSNPTQSRTAVSTPLLPTQLSTDELVAIQVPAMEIPVVEKKRGRKKKQQQQEEEAPSLPDSYASTTSNVIVIDDDAAGDTDGAQPTTTTTTTNNNNTNTKPEKRKPGRPPKNPKSAPTDPSDPLNQDPPPHPPTTTTDLSPNPHNLTNPSEPPTVQTTTPTAPKEPRKKKLKRGKTTSITLTKTYESDIEPDVLWVEEDAMEGNPTKPRRGPSPAVELPSLLDNPSTETNSGDKANAHLKSEAAAAAAAPKKRGRKRKNPDPEASAPASEQEPIRLPEHSDTVEQPEVECLEKPNNARQRIQEGEEAGEEEMPPPQQADPTPDPQPAPEPVATVPVTPLKPNKGPDKHSPISSTSKVPFRVGLSRRARIAPLLKVVKR